MSHPNVENLDRMVLLLSNQQEGQSDRQFLEVPAGISTSGSPAAVGKKKLDIGWFDQAWYAEGCAESADKKSTAYRLRNVHNGMYLQAGQKQSDGSTEIMLENLASKKASRKVQNTQIWEISNDGGFARITNLASKQAFELIESDGGGLPRVCLRDNELTNKESQTWKYERVSRSAQDVKIAMKANGHVRSELTEYQSTDATYLTLPPQIRDEIWDGTGLGKDPLTWKNQIFDCDDFAFTAKAAVSLWAAKNLKGDGFAILFGITFGDRRTDGKLERHAYNWYLDWDTLASIKFFEPSLGTESDRDSDYKGFNGLF